MTTTTACAMVAPSFIDASLEEYDALDKLMRQYALHPHPCVHHAHCDLSAQWGEKGSAKSLRIKVISRFIWYTPQQSPCASVGQASPLDDTWCAALDLALSKQRWRDPFIFVPANDIDNWEQPEASISSSSGCSEARVVVSPTTFHDHVYAAPDLDPWRLGVPGTPPAAGHAGANKLSLRRLPRPPGLDGLSMGNWQSVLAVYNDWSCGTSERFFIPQANWDPTVVGRSKWRLARAFKHGSRVTPKGEKSGPVDRFDQLWAFDAHAHGDHWDVQPVDPMRDPHTNVSWKGDHWKS